MSFRRSSSLSREDGLSLEQRLVMQLTAAMRHEEAVETTDEQPHDNNAHQHNSQPQLQYAPQHAQHPQQPTNEMIQSLQQHPAAQALMGHSHDSQPIDVNEFSTMLRTLGASLESLGSSLGSQSGTAGIAAESHGPEHTTHATALPDQSHPQGHTELHSMTASQANQDHASNDHLSLHGLGSLESLGALSQLGNLGNLLSGIGMHDQSNTHMAASSDTLGNLGLGNLPNLDTSGAAGGDSQASTDFPHSTLPSDSALPSESSVPQGSNQTQQSHPEQAPASPGPSMPAHANTESSTLGLSQVEIDPDVSSIQSVLQSLLMGGTGSHGIGLTEQSQPKTSTDSDNTNESTAAEPAAQNDELPSLANFGLETEDQMLVDSLRSAIESQLSGGAGAGDPSSSVAESAAELEITRPPYRSSRETATKPRTQSRARKPRSQSITPSDDFSASFRDQSSDFGASDPDTLRAIQQALLSALGPSASSTSLTESITTELKASAASTAEAQADTAAAVSQAQVSAVTGKETAQSLDSALRPSAVQASKVAERVLRAPPKKPAAKVTKPTERDRQKLREENAARKRRWREENVLQNRDNDLRARIIRRAQTMYGEGESTEKSEWIEAEYQRRRQKRILRADINSLVANAMESARSRAASEQGGARQPGQPLTLTQQTRQIASTQLSELFRRSNAVLEPQLHSEKLSVPLAPYLLVPSPDRPPYKVEWKKKESKSTTESPAAAERSASPRTGTGSDTDASAVPNESSKSTPDSAPDKPDANEDEPATGSAQATSATTSATTSAADAANSPAATQESSTKIHADQPTEKAGIEKAGLLTMRPKHRYGLVGNAQLGVPPNLAAIYQKVASAVNNS